MPATLTTHAVEKSTYVITVALTDEDGAALTPDSLTWTLTDDQGNVINSRTAVSIAVPAASNDIVLSGADLAVDVAKGTKRKLTLEGVYDSDYGNDLPLKEEVEFEIDDLIAIQ